MVPLHPAIVPLVLAYAAVRGGEATGALFVGVQGRRLTETIMTQTFLRYARAAGVDQRKGSPRTRFGTSSPRSF